MSVSAAQGRTPKEAAIRCQVRPRRHAKRRQAQRGIADDEVRRAIRVGQLRKRRRSWEARTSHLTVVFRLAPCNIFIITVFYRRA